MNLDNKTKHTVRREPIKNTQPGPRLSHTKMGENFVGEHLGPKGRMGNIAKGVKNTT